LGAGNPKHSFDNVCQIEIRKYAHTDIVITEGPIPLRSGSVDAVISEAVLEHVKNPFLYISEIFRILKPEGKVLLDTAFLQPLHGYPSHYFNTTSYAIRLLFESFTIDKLHVGPHQHPWIMLDWILHAYYNGLQSDRDREEFQKMTLGEVMSTLRTHQEQRAAIKNHNDPWFVALKLKDFNRDYKQSLRFFVNITDTCEEELAAGFQVYATKPGLVR
jgi:SAM-dependent methyltransferase